MKQIVAIKPRLGGTQYYLEKKRKQDELIKLTSIILCECGSMRSNIFNTLCWLEQKGMLNEKSVTAFLKYKEEQDVKEVVH